MSDSKPTKFPPAVMSLFDKYVHGLISRREFLDRASGIAVAGLSGAALLDALNPKFAEAQQVAPTDARLKTESVEIAAPGYGKARGYLVQPAKAAGKLPVVMVVHENRGLNPHIEDVTRRIALENFVAFAPDALFPLGGYPGDEDKARTLFQQLDQEKVRQDFLAMAKHVKSLPAGNGKLGVVGLLLRRRHVELPRRAQPRDRCGSSVLRQPAGAGGRGVDQGAAIAAVCRTGRTHQRSMARQRNGIESGRREVSGYIYPGTQHGFNNDTTPRYDKDAAALAWKRTIEFFNQHLRAS